MKSIKTKYLIWFGSLLLAVCIGLGFLSYVTAAKALTDVTNELLTKTVNESAKVVSERVQLRLTEVSTWANTELIKDANSSIEQKMNYLKKEVARAGYLSAAIGDVEGNVTTMSGAVINLSERPYYQSVIQGNLEVTDPIVSKEDNKTLLVNYAVPIKDDSGKVIGVIIGARNGEELSNLTNDIVLGKTGTAFMVNSMGITVAHTDIDKVRNAENTIEVAKTNKALVPVAKIIEKMITGENGVDSYSYNGVKKMVAFSPVKNTKWFIAVNVPTNEVLSSLETLQTSMLIGDIIFLLVALILTYFIASFSVKKIKVISSNIETLSLGDFTIKSQNVKRKGQDELDTAFNALLVMEESISGMIRAVKDTSVDINERSNNLTAISDELTTVFSSVANTLQETNDGVYSQAMALSGIAQIINDFGDKIDHIVKNIQGIDDKSKAIDNLSTKGNNDMQLLIESVQTMSGIFKEFITKVEKLGSSINKVTDITKLINDIAEQTNLLSLNASIEAARAGEHGKGFAVVADEIRKLAEQSKNSSENIDSLIKGISGETHLIIDATSGIDDELTTQIQVINTTIDSYKNIVNAINEISSKISEAYDSAIDIDREKSSIIAKVEDASAVAQEVAASSEQISGSTETVRQSAEDVAHSAVEMGNSVNEMMSQIQKFKV